MGLHSSIPYSHSYLQQDHQGNMSAFMRRQMGASPVMSTMSSGGYGGGYGADYGSPAVHATTTCPDYGSPADDGSASTYADYGSPAVHSTSVCPDYGSPADDGSASTYADYGSPAVHSTSTNICTNQHDERCFFR